MIEILVEVNNLLGRDIAIKILDGLLETASMPEELMRLMVGVWVHSRNGSEVNKKKGLLKSVRSPRPVE